MNDKIKKPVPLEKVCDDRPSLGAVKNEWKYDAAEKKYRRFEDGKQIRVIRGSSLPDPDKLYRSRKETAAILIKHVSASKMSEIADVAIAGGKDPGDEILSQLQVRLEPSAATEALWKHWKGVENANVNH